MTRETPLERETLCPGTPNAAIAKALTDELSAHRDFIYAEQDPDRGDHSARIWTGPPAEQRLKKRMAADGEKPSRDPNSRLN